MPNLDTTIALKIGDRAKHLSDRRVCGLIEGYEFPPDKGRIFMRCDNGYGYWFEPFQLVSALETSST